MQGAGAQGAFAESVSFPLNGLRTGKISELK